MRSISHSVVYPYKAHIYSDNFYELPNMFQFIFESSSELQIHMDFPIRARRKFYNPSYHFVRTPEGDSEMSRDLLGIR